MPTGASDQSSNSGWEKVHGTSQQGRLYAIVPSTLTQLHALQSRSFRCSGFHHAFHHRMLPHHPTYKGILYIWQTCFSIRPPCVFKKHCESMQTVTCLGQPTRRAALGRAMAEFSTEPASAEPLGLSGPCEALEALWVRRCQHQPDFTLAAIRTPARSI